MNPHRSFLVSAILAVLAGCSKPPPPLVADPPVLLPVPGWGQAYDPKRDCQFEVADGQVTIGVPGTPHGLSVQDGDLTSPRILRPVQGDFVATVLVSGTLHPRTQSLSSQYLPYNGAGLLVWQDSNNYIRLERAAILSDGSLRPYINYERWQNGRRVSSRGTAYPDRPALLRIGRKGNRIAASISRDEQHWTPLPAIEVALGPKLRVGVAAVNNTKDPFAAEFSRFQVTGQDREQPEPATTKAENAR